MDDHTTTAVTQTCPHCAVPYKVVRVVSDEPTFREITCVACGGPLQGREGRYVLKYILVAARGRAWTGRITQ